MLKYFDIALTIVSGRVAKDPVDYGLKNSKGSKRKLIKFPVIVNMERSRVILNVEWWLIAPYDIPVKKGDRISFIGMLGQYETKGRTYQKVTMTKLLAINKLDKASYKVATEDDINQVIDDDFYKSIYGG